MTYGYIRVSSDKQTVENQRFEISAFCAKEGLKIDGWIEETASGATMYTKRRLGRNLLMIMEILSFCMHRECKVWTIKDGYRLGDDIQSKVLAFAFGLSAEIERNLISQRTKEALKRVRAEGKRIGRPPGKKSRPELSPLYGKEEYIRRSLLSGISLSRLAKRLHCSRGTLKRYIDKMFDSGKGL